MDAALVIGVALRSTTGSVVIRNSDRSFVRPRSAIAPTGTEELNVKVPLGANHSVRRHLANVCIETIV